MKRCHSHGLSWGGAGEIHDRGRAALGPGGPAAMMAQVWNRVEKETAEALTPVEPALSVENVSHAYGARLALDDVSFTGPSGTFTVLLGRSGAGTAPLF